MIYDFHLQMRGQNFRTQNYFRQKKTRYFIDENALIINILVHSFLRKAWSLSLRLNKIFEESLQIKSQEKKFKNQKNFVGK